MRLDSFFSGALCVLSGGRLPEALFMVFLLDSKGANVSFESAQSLLPLLEQRASVHPLFATSPGIAAAV